MRLKLNGYVSADDDKEIFQWFGYSAFSPKDVRDALEQLPEGETLTLEINSGGGSVWAGSEIYSVLRSSSADTVAEIQSLAASAASYVAIGCNRVMISPVAQMMIHPPSTATSGDAAQHRQSIKILNSIAGSILNAYELKCGGKRTRQQLASMMQAETWLTAQEAVDAGLADEILYDDDAVLNPADIVNACGMPNLAAMRAEYQKAHQAKEPPEATPVDNWQDAARLAIEKLRFYKEANQ